MITHFSDRVKPRLIVPTPQQSTVKNSSANNPENETPRTVSVFTEPTAGIDFKVFLFVHRVTLRTLVLDASHSATIHHLSNPNVLYKVPI